MPVTKPLPSIYYLMPFPSSRMSTVKAETVFDCDVWKFDCAMRLFNRISFLHTTACKRPGNAFIASFRNVVLFTSAAIIWQSLVHWVCQVLGGASTHPLPEPSIPANSEGAQALLESASLTGAQAADAPEATPPTGKDANKGALGSINSTGRDSPGPSKKVPGIAEAGEALGTAVAAVLETLGPIAGDICTQVYKTDAMKCS